MKNQIAGIFCCLAGVLSVNLLFALDAAAQTGFQCPPNSDPDFFCECNEGYQRHRNAPPITGECVRYTEAQCKAEHLANRWFADENRCQFSLDPYYPPSCHFNGCELRDGVWVPTTAQPRPIDLDPPVEPNTPVEPVLEVSGEPLVRTPGAIRSPEPVDNAVSELGIQSAGYAPVSAQKVSPSSESELPEYAAPAALLGALVFSSLYPDYSLNHSFDFSGENENVNWEAGMHGNFSHGSFSSYVSALQSGNGFVIESGTTYHSNSFFASYRTVEAKDYMNYEVYLSSPFKYNHWRVSPNLSSEFHYDRDENHSSSDSGAGLDLEYRF